MMNKETIYKLLTAEQGDLAMEKRPLVMHRRNRETLGRRMIGSEGTGLNAAGTK